MNTPSVPRIFSPARRTLRTWRARTQAQRADAGRFVLEEMADDVLERLAFVRHQPQNPLLIGQIAPRLIQFLGVDAAEIDLEAPYPSTGADFIAVLGVLDAVNDLPGALIHIRNALAPGGLAIASFIGGASLPRLRAAMLAAEPDRPAARMHPLVDPRAAPGLLQRAQWKDPVVDTHILKVRYSSLDRLVQDLRDQGLGSALADRAPPLNRAAVARARTAFLEHAEDDDKVTEIFEIITLTGRRSLAGT